MINKKRLKQLLVGILIFLLLLMGVGLVYHTIGAARDARAFPAPGQLVDIGDYYLHLNCMGEGSPTIILEAPAGGASPYWAWVQPEIAQNHRVCAYDRAGRGWRGFWIFVFMVYLMDRNR